MIFFIIAGLAHHWPVLHDLPVTIIDSLRLQINFMSEKLLKYRKIHLNGHQIF